MIIRVITVNNGSGWQGAGGGESCVINPPMGVRNGPGEMGEGWVECMADKGKASW